MIALFPLNVLCGNSESVEFPYVCSACDIHGQRVCG